jgi:ribonuclease VapC
MAMLFHEPEAEAFYTLIRTARRPVMAATAVVELGIQFDKLRSPDIAEAHWASIESLDITVIPVDPDLAVGARDAHTRYGRWSGSKAKLNFGDCFSYALAIARDEPLLFKGDDFGHTDVKRAIR